MIKPYMRLLPIVPSDLSSVGNVFQQQTEYVRDKFEFVSADDKKQLENAKKSFEAGLKAINDRLDFLERPAVGSTWQNTSSTDTVHVRVLEVTGEKIIYVRQKNSDNKILDAYANDVKWFKQTYPASYPKQPCDC